MSRGLAGFVALRHRDFALLWAGQSVSMIGDGIYTVTLALETLRLDSRPQALSIVIAARLIPTVILLLFGGLLVDRMPRRVAMLVSDTARGLAVLSIALLVATGQARIWNLVVLSIIFGAADALFFPAQTAITPEILPAEFLVQGSALNAMSFTLTRALIGPALGGLLVAAFGYVWGFALDGASFAVSAGCLALMQTRARPEPTGGSVLSDVADGLRYVRSQPWLWVTLVAASIANFAAFSPLSVLVPLLVRSVLNQGPVALGLVLAAGGIGGLLTSLLIGRLGAPRRRVTAIWVAWGVSAAFVLLLGFAPNAWFVGVLELVFSALLAYGNILWTPLMQDLVPPKLLGRASAIDWLLSILLSPLGVLAAGLLAASIGPRLTIVAGASIALVTTVGLFLPGVRDPDLAAA